MNLLVPVQNLLFIVKQKRSGIIIMQFIKTTKIWKRINERQNCSHMCKSTKFRYNYIKLILLYCLLKKILHLQWTSYEIICRTFSLDRSWLIQENLINSKIFSKFMTWISFNKLKFPKRILKFSIRTFFKIKISYLI